MLLLQQFWVLKYLYTQLLYYAAFVELICKKYDDDDIGIFWPQNLRLKQYLFSLFLFMTNICNVYNNCLYIIAG